MILFKPYSIILVISILMLFVLHINCVGPGKISNQNIAYLYKPNPIKINALYSVFHETDSTSILYFSIPSNKLLYTKIDTVNYRSKIKFSYQLFKSYESRELFDSSSSELVHVTQNTNAPHNLSGSVRVKAFRGNSYILKARVVDVNRQNAELSFINVDKNDIYSMQNFRYSFNENLIPVFQNNIYTKVPVYIKHTVPGFTKLYVKVYKSHFPVAAPPFSVEAYKQPGSGADSVFVINKDEYKNFVLYPTAYGIYYLQIDTTKKEGLALLNYGAAYPMVTTIEQLAGPLRYISSNQEYEKIRSAENLKSAIDEFWLNCSVDGIRGKELISTFYRRVEEANIHFTSYTEGWKTDRGIIYVIFGAPNLVYKTTGSEIWIYGEENNIMSLTFNFLKVQNPLSNNDFMLTRSPIYKNTWYRAVDAWRQGRVYSKTAS